MYYADTLNEPAVQTALGLENLAYAGLCAFVVAMSAGGDAWSTGGLVFATWFILSSALFAVLRVCVSRTVRRPSPVHYLLLAFTVLVGISSLWTVSLSSTFQRLGTYIALLMFVVLVWELASSMRRVRGLMVSYVMGAGIASVNTIRNYLAGESTARLEGRSWDTFRYSVEGVNADELALIVALSIPLALYLLLTTKSRLLKAGCWIHLAAGPMAMFLSGTRGAMIALLAGMLLLIGPIVTGMSWKQRAMAAFVTCALAYGLWFYGPKTSLERFLSVGAEVSGGTLTHRTLLWGAGVEVFRSHPFLGVGSGAYGAATVSIVDINQLAHNTFLSVLVELGMIGELVLGAVIVGLFYSAWRLPTFEKRVWLALLVTWMVGACSVSWDYRKTTWFLFGLLAAHAYAANRGLLRLPGRDVLTRPIPVAPVRSRVVGAYVR